MRRPSRMTFTGRPFRAGRYSSEKCVHAVATVGMDRDPEFYPEYAFGLTALCGTYERVAKLDFTKDAAVDCPGCMTVAGVR